MFGQITGWFVTGAPLNYISLHSKSHQKSVRIYLTAGTWNFWGAKRDTSTNLHAFVTKWAVCQIYGHFRLLKNIEYLYISRELLYRSKPSKKISLMGAPYSLKPSELR